MAVWRSYFCYNCKIRRNPGDPESTLETCGDCQLVKFCSDDCKAKALPFHGDECEIRRKDLEQLQTLTAKAKPGVWAFLDQDQMNLVDEYHSLVLELGEETFQRAANTGDFFLHEVALGFSNQIMTFDVVATRRQSRHLYMLILLERIEEMMDFLNKLPETWFGKYDTLGNFLFTNVESLKLLNYKTIFLEAEKQIETRHLLDVIFNIPENLCLWTLSNLTKSQADDIGFLGDKIRKMLPKELHDYLFPIWWKVCHEPKEPQADRDFTDFCASEECSFLTYEEETTTGEDDINDHNINLSVKDPTMSVVIDEETQHPFEN